MYTHMHPYVGTCLHKHICICTNIKDKNIISKAYDQTLTLWPDLQDYAFSDDIYENISPRAEEKISRSTDNWLATMFDKKCTF